MSTHTADRAPLLRLGPTRAIARRSWTVRCGMALAVAGFGCVQVVAVENGAAGTVVGAGLVALAAPLARGRRRALLATAGLVVASFALDQDVIALPGLAAVILLAVLLVCAPAFRASGDPATRRLIVPAAALLAIGLAADLARAFGHLAHPLGATLLIGACLLAARALRPWRSAAADDPEARARAAGIVAQRATDTLAPFTLRADKQFFFSEAGTSFIAYRVVAGVALVSGDPVGDERAFPELIAAFARFTERRGWTLGVLGAGAQRLPLWRDAGLRAHYTGDEAIVNPAAFSLEGRAIRKVRQSVTRLERAGYSAEAVHSGAIGAPLAERIAEIAARWRGDRSETGYSMAFAGAAVDRTRDDLYVIARDAAGEPRGFLHFGCVPGGRALSLSSMRRERDTPNGLNEFLIYRALEHAREHGIERVSLNFAAFALLLDPPAPLDPLSRAERRLLGGLARRFQLERLLSFSEKFEPQWTPRYAAYPSVATLPRIALAAMLAEAYVTLPHPPWRVRRA
ncbi:MAG TPA: phosphatidylglycerol lysyltransferase domain-containing protein [Gaiellales bacterium]|jgi:lysyl-tRNA synthetase class 2|nr:phosphatidylglycerol lysyltransferase domain-containing protein [Gaiellales bacterium]